MPDEATETEAPAEAPEPDPEAVEQASPSDENGKPVQEEQGPLVAATAFLVYQDMNGNWIANSSPSLIRKACVIAREATFNDFTAACAVISRDVQANISAQQSAMFMGQMAKQSIAAAQNDALMRRLQGEGAIPGGIPRPGGLVIPGKG